MHAAATPCTTRFFTKQAAQSPGPPRSVLGQGADELTTQYSNDQKRNRCKPTSTYRKTVPNIKNEPRHHAATLKVKTFQGQRQPGTRFELMKCLKPPVWSKNWLVGTVAQNLWQFSGWKTGPIHGFKHVRTQPTLRPSPLQCRKARVIPHNSTLTNYQYHSSELPTVTEMVSNVGFHNCCCHLVKKCLQWFCSF